MFLKNFYLYHRQIESKKTLISIAASVLFIVDILSDIAYLSQKGLTRVEINQKIWNLRRIMIASVVSPLAIEALLSIFFSKLSQGLGLQFKITEIIAKLLNQEKCLNMPADLKNLAAYDQE